MRPTLLALALFTSLAAAQEKPAPPPEAKPDAAKEKSDKPTEPVTRDGSVTIDGKKIDYQVTTAKLVIEKDDGAPRASIFHVSYLKKNAGDLSKRPVLFAFNGGPGSSAVWLHLGTLGPKRVDLPGDGTQAPVPPAKLVPNEFSILDVADLVGRNPIIVTALNPVIGYEKGAKIAKRAYAEGRLLREVALEETDLTGEELDRILDPRGLTEGGIHE